MEFESVDRLILLVGSNPLPNYLTALALRPREVALVHSRQTAPVMERLASALDGEGMRVVEPPPFVEDAADATALHRVITRLTDVPGAVHLNYTGGTKVMAAHARLAFDRRGGSNSRASYLDGGAAGGGARLRFDDGTSMPLDVTPSLSPLLRLHGIKAKPRKPPGEGEPTAADLEAMVRACLSDHELAGRLYRDTRRWTSIRRSRRPLLKVADYGLDLSIEELGTPAQSKGVAKRWARFLMGEWLEAWVAHVVRHHCGTDELALGLTAYRGPRPVEFEVDVVFLRGCRTFCLSVTTAAKKDMCKSKIFEVIVRSRQVAGDLARSGLVCLANDELVDQLEKEVENLWNTSRRVAVFGLSDLRSWAGLEDGGVSVASLNRWLES